VDDDQETIWAAMNEIYAGFLTGDPDRTDRHIDPDATIWDSAEPDLIRGRDELEALRGRRPPSTPPDELAASDPVIDVWGDVALVRHLLTVVEGGQTTRIRNTSVWRRRQGSWLVVHNHEDVLGPR
jgi:ketosteroid isomerase-like protein